MIIEKNQIFNLMDTNGRRSDVLNALKVYLEILEELKEEYPTEAWNNYPNSVAQFVFYEKALEKSKEIFKVHKNYDSFIDKVGGNYQEFLGKDETWIEDNFSGLERILDEAIEKRARHYTSNLVKIGFTDATRNVTEAGYSYLKNSINRDAIEEFLPLDNINISLLRQLAKLKVFGQANQAGKREYYSPFLMALYLLLSQDAISQESFSVIVQGLTPYASPDLKNAVCNGSISLCELEASVKNKNIEIPQELTGIKDIEFELFKKYFKSSKSNDVTLPVYYAFYSALKRFRENKNQENYNALLKILDQSGSLINKAFGFGKAIFQAGNKNGRYDLNGFLEKNANHELLANGDFVARLYSAFCASKWVDGIKEYSDTTIRLLSATGLFKFKNLPELAYKEILSLIFDADEIKAHVFGEISNEEFVNYEDKEGYFGKNTPISSIFNYSEERVENIIDSVKAKLGASSVTEVKFKLKDKTRAGFISHIHSKYPKEKIIELLPLFSDRRNDAIIKKEVNDTATVPTIYEYVIAVAWYYISNQSFDLYSSLNLTLNADFEPVLHAGGGDGDIVIDFEDIVVMLEVTLMNKQAQKRGEWEPVLRHSLNLKARSEPKEVITFFIADELDYNTINIWRAVASVSLESTNTHRRVDGVVIMPFTNENVLEFLKNDISHQKIIEKVKESYAKIPQITNSKWHDEILSEINV